MSSVPIRLNDDILQLRHTWAQEARISNALPPVSSALQSVHGGESAGWRHHPRGSVRGRKQALMLMTKTHNGDTAACVLWASAGAEVRAISFAEC